jgi:hypothetical protein
MDELSPLSTVPAAVSTVSVSLYNYYSTLSSGARDIFRRVYSSVWSYLWPFSKLDAISHVYDLPAALSSLSPALTTSEFLLLSRLWSLSFGGVRAVDSRAVDLLQRDSYTRAGAFKIQKAGLITRSHFDPLHPHQTSYRAMNHVFISITPKGIKYFKQVLKVLNRTVAQDHHKYETYRHEKRQIE